MYQAQCSFQLNQINIIMDANVSCMLMYQAQLVLLVTNIMYANASCSMFFLVIWNQNIYVCKCIMYANLSCMQCSFLWPAKIATVLIEAIIPQRSCWMLRERCWLTTWSWPSPVLILVLVLLPESWYYQNYITTISTSLLRNSSLWKDK